MPSKKASKSEKERAFRDELGGLKSDAERKLAVLTKLADSIRGLAERHAAGAALDAQQRAKLERQAAVEADRAALEKEVAATRREGGEVAGLGTYRINCFFFKHYDPRWSKPQPRLTKPEVVADFGVSGGDGGGAAAHPELARLAAIVEAKMLRLHELGYRHHPRTSPAFNLEFSFCLSNAIVKPQNLTNPFWTPNGGTVIEHNFITSRGKTSAVNLTDPRRKGVPGTTPAQRALVYVTHTSTLLIHSLT